MRKGNKKMASLMIMVLILNIFSVIGYAGANVVEEAIEVGTVDSGKEFEVEFGYKVDEGSIKVPEGIEFIRYEHNDDKYKYIFKANKSMDDVTIKFVYKEIEEDNKETDGEGTIVDRPDSPAASEQLWEHFRNDKMGWSNGDGTVLYSISINLDKSPYLKGVKEITVKDFANHPVKGDIKVLYYTKSGEYTSYPIEDYTKTISDISGNDFVINIDIPDDVTGIDIKYNSVTSVLSDGTPPSNRYEIWTNNRKIISGGFVDGKQVEKEIIEDTEDEDTVCPPCKCEDSETNKKIKELEDENNKLKEENGKLKEKIKEMENNPTIIYSTEVIYNKVIEKVTETIEIPYYITEVRFETIVKEVIKEVEVPVYTTDYEYIEIIKDHIQDKLEKEQLDNVDLGKDKNINKDGEDIVLLPENENNVVELEDNIKEDVIIDEEIKEETSDEYSNNDNKEDSKTVTTADNVGIEENTEEPETNNKEKLPATGQARNVAIMIVGITLLIYGIALKRRG